MYWKHYPNIGPEICGEIDHEIERARRHGAVFSSLHEGYAVLLEEVDELWDIAKQKRCERDERHLRAELVQDRGDGGQSAAFHRQLCWREGLSA